MRFTFPRLCFVGVSCALSSATPSIASVASETEMWVFFCAAHVDGASRFEAKIDRKLLSWEPAWWIRYPLLRRPLQEIALCLAVEVVKDNFNGRIFYERVEGVGKAEWEDVKLGRTNLCLRFSLDVINTLPHLSYQPLFLSFYDSTFLCLTLLMQSLCEDTFAMWLETDF